MLTTVISLLDQETNYAISAPIETTDTVCIPNRGDILEVYNKTYRVIERSIIYGDSQFKITSQFINLWVERIQPIDAPFGVNAGYEVVPNATTAR